MEQRSSCAGVVHISGDGRPPDVFRQGGWVKLPQLNAAIVAAFPALPMTCRIEKMSSGARISPGTITDFGRVGLRYYLPTLPHLVITLI